MKKQKEKSIIRYVIKANGEEIDWEWDETKAWVKAHNFAEKCSQQDDNPWSPKMEVVAEQMN